MALFAEWIIPYSPFVQNISDKLQSPSLTHWMGTDLLGRDVWSRIIYGSRITLLIGLSSTFITLFIGTSIGTCMGVCAGVKDQNWANWVDTFLMRFIEILLAIPPTLLAILLTLIVGKGTLGIIFIISFTTWASQAHFTRGLVLKTRNLPYIEAAQSLGNSQFNILRKHIFPNISDSILISFVQQLPVAILSESFLSFIGLGLQPPHFSWGTLTYEGFRAMQSYPHLIFFPGAFLFLTLYAFHSIEQSIRKKRSL